MEQLLKIRNVKTEPTESTSSSRLEIPSEMQLNSSKEGSDCLVPSAIYIKTEPQEDENEFPVISETYHKMGLSDDINFDIYEPIVQIECKDETMQDPLYVASEIKVEASTSMSVGETNKLEWTEEEINEEYLSIFDDEESHEGEIPLINQNTFFIPNKEICKDKKHICHICNKTFEYNCDLIGHLRMHTGEKPFTCEICKKSFSRKSHLTAHVIIHSGVKPHVCEICKKVFSQRSNLKTHMLIHSGVSFSCNECKKSFTRKHHLITHKLLHTGDKPYACDLCGKAFVRKPHLARHKRLHSEDKPFSCDVCKKTFAQKSYLNIHRKIHMR